MGLLDGKVVFITGAARGQGRAHAVTAAKEGADVIITDICSPVDGIRYALASKEDLDKTQALVEKQGRRAVSALADVRDQGALDAAVALGLDAFGRLDAVIANAGLWDLGPKSWEITEQMWTTVTDVVLGGTFRTIKATAPHLVEQRGGAIVCIASVGGLEATAGYTHYITAKHGVLGLMKNTALEIAEYNVRCNAVCPGAVDAKIWDNPMGHQLFVAPGETANRDVAIAATYGYAPLAGRPALPPNATSNAACWLLSDYAEHITGVALPVDAGHLLLPGVNFAPQTEGPEADRYRSPAQSPDDL
ncbi:MULTISPECIES: mycofactocin-coupled SDR family oxidoreductase [Rhodococcus]|uniref:Mycofactocin-coupled SDR family oxidoreductase n=1 Tax=Rhodococcus oxybenzonivorans TaxID=1990687 RepID=A0AAE4V544_9NOCA|nr:MULTISPECIES: mycofactocin-coupled SDR family oxidoreductase [Rhodococcus]MDV7242635.1 mycofactocin-coupled SDR family oxidoreductase [Rhodococcus oxybenzonivorans]MDV7268407.1 mycofactocin-coupled SDR family oxidoreductase [Rhodococcus oxybenzonivorans]MDV7276068.1 mycofactocin-coupled SDR family oxidoreductase [Rhodococcus oxybenzonivorans]MDV7332123.1 mycofactocin-coupled SDR family oxidoreductase [Rhodococcus oxybenzonivorans]MDV7344328.1 mycofactocin-coupled SDR family oxidoreductase [